MISKLTLPVVKKYLFEEYQEREPHLPALLTAIKKVAKEYNVDKIQLFHLFLENRPMYGTHSYGFHTAFGRALIEGVRNHYDYLVRKGLKINKLTV